MTGKFSYQLNPALELTAKLGFHDDDRERPGSLTEAEITTVGRRGSMTPADGQESDQYNFGLGADIIPDVNNSYSIQFYFNNSDRNSLSSIPGSGSSSIDDEENNYSLSFRYSSNHAVFGRKNKAILGIDLLKEELVAELGAMFCLKDTEHAKAAEQNSFAYLKAWSSKLQDKPQEFLSAISKAQKAMEFIFNIPSLQK